jgi:tetratricopeptide (TPR) repeat protein
MLHLLFAAAVLIQEPEDDPIKAAETDLGDLLKKITPLGIGGAREYLELAGQHAARQFAGRETKKGLTIMTNAFDGLVKVIQGGETKPAELKKVVLLLEKGKRRAAAAGTDEDKVVAFRFAVDRVTLIYQAEAGNSAGLFNLAVQYLSEANYAEAEELLADAEAMLPALKGSSIETVPEGPRWASVILAHVLVCRGKYKEAAAAVRRGLATAPELAEKEIAFETLHKKEGSHGKVAAALAEHLKGNAEDKDALLLQAFEVYFSEKRADSEPILQKVLKLDPKDEAAKLLLEGLEGK